MLNTMRARLLSKRWGLGLAMLLAINSKVCSQDFLEGIHLYNRARYDSLIYVFVPQFLKNHPHEEGLARYFLAESYYNKALLESDPEKISTFLRHAWSQFKQAQSRSDLRLNFREYYHVAKYKLGWCSYRLAELKEDPIEMLRRAYQEFQDLEAEAPDSLKLFSDFLAGESKIRENLLRMYRIFDQNYRPEDINEMVRSFAAASEVLTQVVTFVPSAATPQNLPMLQAAALLKRQSIKYHLGKFYSGLPPEAFQLVTDPMKKSDAQETALAYFKRVQYDTLGVSHPEPTRYRTAITYLNAMNQFNQFLLARSEDTKRAFFAEWEKLSDPRLKVERWFRRANLFHALPETPEVDHVEMAISAYDSAHAIPESDYWKACLLMIQGDPNRSREKFARFIQLLEGDRYLGDRKKFLLEDAHLRKFLLDFESYYLSNQFSQLKKLAAQVNEFSPHSIFEQKQKEQLNLLISASLTGNTSQLWSEVLAGSDEQKIQQVMTSIRFMLHRAALNIGSRREKYLILLNRLFDITRNQLREETRFFKGVVKTLEAEIQARPDEKIEKFKEAAEMLDRIDPAFSFKSEADYLKGICWFYAEEFERAKTIFQNLINQKKSLRALFYMAEIFRLSDQGLAAKSCYEAIISKLQNSGDNFSQFWLINAQAGLASCDDSGGSEALTGMNYQLVELIPEPGVEQLIFEKLADESFLEHQNMQESILSLLKFGLPQKELYPSKNKLARSIFLSENPFEFFGYLIDEAQGPITARLKLLVILPDQNHSTTAVQLGQQTLKSQQGGLYTRYHIPLNAAYELLIDNSACYPHRQTIKFVRPGEENRVVVLSKKIAFSDRQTSSPLHKQLQSPFPSRWDGNYVMNNDIPPQNQDSQLLADFSGSYALRDLVLDRKGNRILAVDAAENSIWIYSNDASSKRIGTLHLELEDSLNSPEGLAMDSNGRLFVSDWSNHRVLQFDSNGKQLSIIGSFGFNSLEDVGQPIKLAFPTRIAVLEDLAGVAVEGETYFRESYLFVADQNGIHVCNLAGEYLATPFSPNANFARGSFYSFAIKRFKDDVRLYIVSRTGPWAGRVFEYASN